MTDLTMTELNDKIKLNLNTRMKFLYYKSYFEENIVFDFDEHDDIKDPKIILYPRSFVYKTKLMDHTKNIDYNFIGSVFFTTTFKNRRWIFDFIKKKFTDLSYLVFSDAVKNINPKRWKNMTGGEPLGKYDKTLEYNNTEAYVPTSSQCNSFDDYVYFDEKYFKIMCQSKFTLCPMGDAPWSMRFFESIMCKSIPILEKDEHTGRFEKERNIGYKYYLINDEHVFREDWVEYNYELFIKMQTLIKNI